MIEAVLIGGWSLFVWAMFGVRYYRLQQRNALGSLSPAWIERWRRDRP